MQPTTDKQGKENFLLTIGLVVYQLNESILEQTLISLHKEVIKFLQPVRLFLLDNFPSNKNSAALQKLAIKFPELHVKIIHVGKNIGYGASNNLAIFQSNAPYHLVLNPDIFFQPGSLIAAMNYIQAHADIGLLCPAIFGENGVRHYVHRKHPTWLDLLLRNFSSLTLVEKYFAQRLANFELRHLNWDQPQEIFSPSGCCMLFRTSEIKKIQGFDPKFFLYYEDSDLGRRLQKVTRLSYLPDFKVIHLWAREAHKTRKMKWQMIRSGLRYLMKWSFR